MQTLKDKYLLFRIKTLNDTDAYGTIYDRYAPRIYRFIYFKVAVQADAEDIVSETFLKAWQYINEDQPVKNLNALLYSIARNLVIDFYRFQAKKRSYEEPVTIEIGGNTGIANKIDSKQSEKRILGALKNLKNEYSEVIILRFFDDISISDIAKIIGKSQNNTRVLIHRALQSLKRVIEPQNDTLA
ncbi:RNA polymerase sigma factor [Candidatus Parcubacteria bacterium]|nr:RNA polymerase sigma factor [Candidatus Parcubacteria bacterium]